MTEALACPYCGSGDFSQERLHKDAESPICVCVRCEKNFLFKETVGEAIDDRWAVDVAKESGTAVDDRTIAANVDEWEYPDRFADVWHAAGHRLSREFYKVLVECAEMHQKKQLDYGRENDPFANIRASEEWGIDAWLGSFVRAGDKVARIKTYVRTGKLSNEGVEDSMLDLAVYAIIGLVLFREGVRW